MPRFLKLVVLKLVVACATVALAATGAPVTATAMDKLRWSYRPLVVFAPTPAHPDLIRQRSTLSGSRSGLRQRQVVVVTVIGSLVTADLGPAPGLSAEALRARFGVAQDAFRTVLIGKDGSVKLASDGALSSQRLFATIDAMPMRREEMRRGRSR
ncbi:MAG: DUF4174 domain-containing protein [Hyphomicrobiaceae bacterium]